MRCSTSLRFVPALLALASLAPLGCSGEVVLIDHASESVCVPAPPSTPDSPEPIAVSGVKSASFIGEMLHLEATVDGAPRYLVLAVDSDTTAHVAAFADALLGPARLVEIAPGLHARLRSDDGATHVDLVTTADPAHPALFSTFTPEGIIDPPDVFSVADDHLYFGLRPSTTEGRKLVSIDLGVPAEPSLPVVVPSYLSDTSQERRFDARGATWIAWNLPTGYFMQDTFVHAVAPSGAEKLVDYGYNQTGVHQYGNVVRASTDGAYAVFDPENPSLFLLADARDGASAFTWAHLSVGASRRLLGVVDAIAYLTTPDGVRAYDIADIEAPVLLPFEASVAFDGEARLLASSSRFLVVVDDADLYLVPRAHAGVVAPLVVHAAPPPPPRDRPAPCGP